MYILLHDVQIIGYYTLHIKYILMTYHSKAILLIQGTRIPDFHCYNFDENLNIKTIKKL